MRPMSSTIMAPFAVTGFKFPECSLPGRKSYLHNWPGLSPKCTIHRSDNQSSIPNNFKLKREETEFINAIKNRQAHELVLLGLKIISQIFRHNVASNERRA